MYRIHTEYVLTEDNLWANEEGTPVLGQIMSDAGVIPTRNWSTGSFDKMEGINSDAYLKIRTKNRACYQCAIGCRQFHEVDGIAGEGPEYETIAICGANCGIGDIGALAKFNQECDELGLDTISTGAVVALAMDLTEKGVQGLRPALRPGRQLRHGTRTDRQAAKASAPSWRSAPAPWPPSTAIPSWRWRSRTWSCRATTRAARSA